MSDDLRARSVDEVFEDHLRLATEHRLDTSTSSSERVEPGEECSFCFVDAVGLVLPHVRAETRIPRAPLG